MNDLSGFDGSRRTLNDLFDTLFVGVRIFPSKSPNFFVTFLKSEPRVPSAKIVIFALSNMPGSKFGLRLPVFVETPYRLCGRQ